MMRNKLRDAFRRVERITDLLRHHEFVRGSFFSRWISTKNALRMRVAIGHLRRGVKLACRPVVLRHCFCPTIRLHLSPRGRRNLRKARVV